MPKNAIFVFRTEQLGRADLIEQAFHKNIKIGIRQSIYQLLPKGVFFKKESFKLDMRTTHCDVTAKDTKNVNDLLSELDIL